MISTFSIPMRRSSLGHVVRGFLNVGLVLFKRAHAGDAEEIIEFIQKTLLIVAGEIDCGRGQAGKILSGRAFLGTKQYSARSSG